MLIWHYLVNEFSPKGYIIMISICTTCATACRLDTFSGAEGLRRLKHLVSRPGPFHPMVLFLPWTRSGWLYSGFATGFFVFYFFFFFMIFGWWYSKNGLYFFKKIQKKIMNFGNCFMIFLVYDYLKIVHEFKECLWFLENLCMSF
jgi:hypothetical protein